jgi:hypothetical protein
VKLIAGKHQWQLYTAISIGMLYSNGMGNFQVYLSDNAMSTLQVCNYECRKAKQQEVHLTIFYWWFLSDMENGNDKYKNMGEPNCCWRPLNSMGIIFTCKVIYKWNLTCDDAVTLQNFSTLLFVSNDTKPPNLTNLWAINNVWPLVYSIATCPWCNICLSADCNHH